MTSIEDLIEQAVERAVTRALQVREGPALRTALNVVEAARSLGVNERTIRKLVDEGLLRKVPNMGRRVLISTTELERFANGG